VVNGISANASAEAIFNIVKDVFLKASDDLLWLSPGDTVLLKPALNSAGPYSAITHPLSLLAVAEVMEERGAKVVVGDHPGMEHVLTDQSGSYRVSSKAVFEQSGLDAGNRLKFVGFEEEGWEDGYRKYRDPASAWKNGFYITKWIDKADHIVNLPRLSVNRCISSRTEYREYSNGNNLTTKQQFSREWTRIGADYGQDCVFNPR